MDWKPYVEIDARYFRPAEVDILMGDASKARRKLGWQPLTSFRDLVRLMIDAEMQALQSPHSVAVVGDD